eukprot:6489326-Pyramimonas_sp.AAC.1
MAVSSPRRKFLPRSAAGSVPSPPPRGPYPGTRRPPLVTPRHPEQQLSHPACTADAERALMSANRHDQTFRATADAGSTDIFSRWTNQTHPPPEKEHGIY